MYEDFITSWNWKWKLGRVWELGEVKSMPASFAVDSEASLYFLCVRERENRRFENRCYCIIVIIVITDIKRRKQKQKRDFYFIFYVWLVE